MKLGVFGREITVVVLALALAISPELAALPAEAQTASLTPDQAAQQAALQAQLDEVNKEISDQTALLQSKQKETSSIARDIAILDFQISTAKLKIQQQQIKIKQLGGDIGKKEVVITDLTDRGNQEKDSLSELLRQTREMDDVSLPEVALSGQSLSELFTDFDDYDQVNSSINTSFKIINDTKTATVEQKTVLQQQQAAEIDAENAIAAQKKTIEQSQKQKQVLLNLSKSQENTYKSVIATKQAEKQKILNALFKLRGANTSINFGQALAYAKVVAQGTGVRPAFLLAIITQESNLGANVGTCNRPGDPASKSWKNIMKPTRDYDPYVRITTSLGLDPDIQPLSCPLGGSGYGGAMGPAQFIPSTWELYINRVAKVTGNNPPNPWNPQDAFAASGLLLADLGASAGTYSAERTAALKYYAGGGWSKASNAFYGNDVMNIATNYQSQIDLLAK